MSTLTPLTTKPGFKFVFLEGPRWHDNSLYFSDMVGGQVYKISEDGSNCEVVVELEHKPSGLGFLPDGSLVVVSMKDRKLLKFENNQLSVIADLSTLANGETNDSVTDSKGRTYIGNFGFDLWNNAPAALANLVLVTPDGSARVVADQINFPNGTIITDGGKTLVVAETWGNVLSAFDIAEDGGLSNRRVWAKLDGKTPDGICLDEEGAIWVASFDSGEFLRVKEGGEITDVIDVIGEDGTRKRAVACQLGGSDGKTLFCLTYGASLEELSKGKAAGAIETIKVKLGRGGSP